MPHFTETSFCYSAMSHLANINLVSNKTEQLSSKIILLILLLNKWVYMFSLFFLLFKLLLSQSLVDFKIFPILNVILLINCIIGLLANICAYINSNQLSANDLFIPN